MKKLFSISFMFLIVLSGMHLSIATHYCGGELAAVKWSFSGKKATCGMEDSKSTCPTQNSITSNCCQNEIAVYVLDNNYSPSTFQFKEVTKNLLQVLYIPANMGLHDFTHSISTNANVSPPGINIASEVRLSDICVFRI